MHHRHRQPRFTGLAGIPIQDWQEKLTEKGSILFENRHNKRSQRIIDALLSMPGVKVKTVVCKGGKYNFPAFAAVRDKTMLEFTTKQHEEKEQQKQAA